MGRPDEPDPDCERLSSIERFAVLVTLRAEFELGNDRALLETMNTCCLHNLPLPGWASTAFVERYRRGHHGEIKSWDEVFGRPTRYGTAERLKRKMEDGRRVVEEIGRLRAAGESLNEEEFSAIGRRLGVGGKTKVKELWHDARLWAERWRALLRAARD
jgi:hypothetical protein